MPRWPHATPTERITALKAEHPFRDHRRIWTHLPYVDSSVSIKSALRHHEDERAAGEAEPQAAGQAQSGRHQAAADRPNESWGIDTIKFMIEGFGWGLPRGVLEWRRKKVVGRHAGLQARAGHWLSL
jgi:hypothetical protein